MCLCYSHTLIHVHGPGNIKLRCFYCFKSVTGMLNQNLFFFYKFLFSFFPPSTQQGSAVLPAIFKLLCLTGPTLHTPTSSRPVYLTSSSSPAPASLLQPSLFLQTLHDLLMIMISNFPSVEPLPWAVYAAVVPTLIFQMKSNKKIENINLKMKFIMSLLKDVYLVLLFVTVDAPTVWLFTFRRSQS